jgi:predicted enzyme related to lactoylglutathione lyase
VVSAQRAIAFYTAVLGWEVMNPDKGLPAPLPAIKAVHLFNKGKAIHGSFCVVEETQIAKTWDADNAAKMSILPNFRVEDMEKTLELAKANGGQILM